MKEIGEQFREAREEIGISIGEVSSDLSIDEILIENLEEGNSKAFKDVLELKDIIAAYAKYLGLEPDRMLDDFNDYLFEKTSKISIEDIKERLAKSRPVEKKVKSPYTMIKNYDQKPKIIMIMAIAIIILLLVLFYVVLRMILIG